MEWNGMEWNALAMERSGIGHGMAWNRRRRRGMEWSWPPHANGLSERNGTCEWNGPTREANCRRTWSMDMEVEWNGAC